MAKAVGRLFWLFGEPGGGTVTKTRKTGQWRATGRWGPKSEIRDPKRQAENDLAVSMQLAIEFPLTLTLSPEERELLSAVWGCFLNGDSFPAPPMVSLFHGERAGVRGNGSSN